MTIGLEYLSNDQKPPEMTANCPSLRGSEQRCPVIAKQFVYDIAIFLILETLPDLGFLIDIQLTYNVILVSSIQHNSLVFVYTAK